MSNRGQREAVRLASLFRALSCPNRVELLRLLAEGCCEGNRCCTAEDLSLCINSLADRLGLVKSTVSHHLRELEAAGLIALAKRGRHNDFSVNRALLKQAGEFLGRLTGCCEVAASCGETKE